MLEHAWDAYERHAWGADELLPLSLASKNWYGQHSLYSTPVDALDSLFIMRSTKRYSRAKLAVLEDLDFSKVNAFVNVFETTIRVLGGLLSAYDLDGDGRLLAKAVDLADRLLGAFETKTGIPLNYINLATGDFRPEDMNFEGEGVASLAEAGTLQLEFQYLSEVTGNPIYAEKAMFALEQILALPKQIPGMYPTYLSYNSLTFTSSDYSVGACSDSFYEYLLKLWISTGDERYWDAYYEAAQGIRQNMARETSDGRLMYIPITRTTLASAPKNAKLSRLFRDNFYEHLSCFAGGMFATGALAHRTGNWTDHLKLGSKVAELCYIGYNITKTGLGGEFSLENGVPFGAEYHLRPEVIESIFYMWRYTHDPKYREWGWQIAQSLNKWARLPVGFSGIRDVNNFHPICDPTTGEPIFPPGVTNWNQFNKYQATHPPLLPPNARVSAQRPSETYPYVDCIYRIDLQESFFLAETLKYLYLLFADDDILPLDKYVFNTEAHPLSIRGFGPRANKQMASLVSESIRVKYKHDKSAMRQPFTHIGFDVTETREFSLYEFWDHIRMRQSRPPLPVNQRQAEFDKWLKKFGLGPDSLMQKKVPTAKVAGKIGKTGKRKVATDISPAGAAALAGMQPEPKHKLGMLHVPQASPKSEDLSHHGKAAIAANNKPTVKNQVKGNKNGVAKKKLLNITDDKVENEVFGLQVKPKSAVSEDDKEQMRMKKN
ncbi:Mannosyl-oligosaccharide 1,2-alpha-mannosidase IB [Nowakowskiella sp. JEL0078]|nr:Mannosyl-oligosaccharide 1,2-alpha-mannosidase IB [Nowakowskiella sp. JEL0078]